MERIGLDIYDDKPKGMLKYIRSYGYHFNKKACELAVSLMRKKNPSTGKKERIEPMSKDEVDELMKKFNIVLDNNVMYDYVYVANMAKARLLRSSIIDEMHLCLHVKDVIDDVDATDGDVFNGWYAKMVHSGMPIEWDDMF